MLKLLALISYGSNWLVQRQKLNPPTTGLPGNETIDNHKNHKESGQLMKIRLFYSTLAALAFSSVHASAPEGFTTICTLDESCAVDASTLVAFGHEDTFSYRTLSGNFVCNGSTFGIVGKTNPAATCMTLDSAALTSSSSSSSSGVSNPSNEAVSGLLPTGLYAIVSRSSGKALAIAEGSSADGALLVQEDFSSEPHQLWRIEDLGNGYHSITAHHSNKTMDLQDFTNKDGVKLQQNPWMNSWDQHWVIQKLNGGYFRINARQSNQTLDVYEMNRKNGGPVCLWTYWGGDNQQWRILPVGAPINSPKPTTP